VAGSYEYDDKPSGSGATKLVFRGNNRANAQELLRCAYISC
jgi:hypothetical protein